MANRTPTALQDERYLLLSRSGRGGMGSVYRAFDRVRQTVVALKVLTDNRRRGPAHPLASEFDAWTRLEHENVVQAYEMSVSRTGPFPAETPYLVLEHTDGLPAHRALAPGRTAPAVLERFAVEVLRGLAHVHAAGLVHRDLKPSNVLVNRRGDGGLAVKITDFGLAAATGVTEPPGTISGSLPFVSPESLVGLPLDGRADLYGLGILLYHIAAGAMPAAGGTVDDLVRWHLDGPPADPRRLRPRCPVRLARFVRRLTARAREERPASAVAALGLLNREVRAAPEVGPPLTGLAELAELRLALDAARLGARRVYRLPDCPVRATALAREVRVWSQVRGLSYCDFGDDTSRTGHPDGRAILGLLLELGPEAEAVALRHDLQRWAPVRLLGGVPLEDRGAGTGRPSTMGGCAARCERPGFLRAFVRRRTLIVRMRGRGLVGWIGRELADALRPPNGSRRSAPGAGGLLVVLDPNRPPRFSPATGPDSSGRG